MTRDNIKETEMAPTTPARPEEIQSVGPVPVSDPSAPREDPKLTDATTARNQLEERANSAGLEVWKDYARGLPEGVANWRVGAAYICRRHFGHRRHGLHSACNGAQADGH